MVLVYMREKLFRARSTGNIIFSPKISSGQSLQIFQIAVFKPPQSSSCYLLLVAADWLEAVLLVNLE